MQIKHTYLDWETRRQSLLQKFSEFAKLFERSDDLQNIQQPIPSPPHNMSSLMATSAFRLQRIR